MTTGENASLCIRVILKYILLLVYRGIYFEKYYGGGRGEMAAGKRNEN